MRVPLDALALSVAHQYHVGRKLSFDDCRNVPLVFADRVIRQIIDHLGSPDLVATDKDFANIRSVFRRCKGSWECVWNGDLVHNELLKTIVTSWIQMPGRIHETEATNA